MNQKALFCLLVLLLSASPKLWAQSKCEQEALTKPPKVVFQILPTISTSPEAQFQQRQVESYIREQLNSYWRYGVKSDDKTATSESTATHSLQITVSSTFNMHDQQAARDTNDQIIKEVYRYSTTLSAILKIVDIQTGEVIAMPSIPCNFKAYAVMDHRKKTFKTAHGRKNMLGADTHWTAYNFPASGSALKAIWGKETKLAYKKIWPKWQWNFRNYLKRLLPFQLAGVEVAASKDGLVSSLKTASIDYPIKMGTKMRVAYYKAYQAFDQTHCQANYIGIATLEKEEADQLILTITEGEKEISQAIAEKRSIYLQLMPLSQFQHPTPPPAYSIVRPN